MKIKCYKTIELIKIEPSPDWENDPGHEPYFSNGYWQGSYYGTTNGGSSGIFQGYITQNRKPLNNNVKPIRLCQKWFWINKKVNERSVIKEAIAWRKEIVKLEKKLEQIFKENCYLKKMDG